MAAAPWWRRRGAFGLIPCRRRRRCADGSYRGGGAPTDRRRRRRRLHPDGRAGPLPSEPAMRPSGPHAPSGVSPTSAAAVGAPPSAGGVPRWPPAEQPVSGESPDSVFMRPRRTPTPRRFGLWRGGEGMGSAGGARRPHHGGYMERQPTPPVFFPLPRVPTLEQPPHISHKRWNVMWYGKYNQRASGRIVHSPYMTSSRFVICQITWNGILSVRLARTRAKKKN